jgi:hypothetical protein
VSGGEGGFNLAQPPEVQQHVVRKIHKRGDCSSDFLSGPAQELSYLPAAGGES